MALSQRELRTLITNLLIDPDGSSVRPEVQLRCVNRGTITVHTGKYEVLQKLNGNTAEEVVEALGGISPIQQRLLERLNEPGRGSGTVVFVITADETGTVGIRNLAPLPIF